MTRANGMIKRSALVVVMAVIINACGGDSGTTQTQAPTETPPVSTAPTITTSEQPTTTPESPTTTAEAGEMRIATESIEVWNSGDVDAYLAFFADNAVLVGGFSDFTLDADHVREGFEFYMALGNQWTVDDCEEPVDGRIRCHGVERDSLGGPAGVLTEADYDFWIEDGKITRFDATVYDESSWYFIKNMSWWLESAYPEVWESGFALDERCDYRAEYNCWESWYATGDTAALLLEHVEEFIAQSDHYPISG